jgi:hypothetical protein
MGEGQKSTMSDEVPETRIKIKVKYPEGLYGREKSLFPG